MQDLSKNQNVVENIAELRLKTGKNCGEDISTAAAATTTTAALICHRFLSLKFTLIIKTSILNA